MLFAVYKTENGDKEKQTRLEKYFLSIFMPRKEAETYTLCTLCILNFILNTVKRFSGTKTINSPKERVLNVIDLVQD